MDFFPPRFLDLWLVQLLSAAPLAWLLSRRISARLRPPLAVAAVGFSLLCWSLSNAWMGLLSEDNLLPSVLQQLLVTTPLLLGVILFLQPRFKYRKEHQEAIGPDTNSSRWLWGSVLLLALLPAGVYRMSRIQSAIEQLDQYQSQMRIGEFIASGRDLLKIAPAATYQEQPLARVLQLWEEKEAELSRDLPQIPEREQQARLLAMLGRRSEALDRLGLDRQRDGRTPSRCLLAATIYEHEQNWTQSRFWYEQARQQLKVTDAESTPLLASAYRGIGFCLRKQGKYSQAESAYLKLLELDPSAQTHFLLAQFYEDTQAGEKSARHLERAVELEPAQYRQQAAEMRAHLQSHQFSCFRLWR